VVPSEADGMLLSSDPLRYRDSGEAARDFEGFRRCFCGDCPLAESASRSRPVEPGSFEVRNRLAVSNHNDKSDRAPPRGHPGPIWRLPVLAHGERQSASIGLPGGPPHGLFGGTIALSRPAAHLQLSATQIGS